ncbi:hypothetical protein K0A97_01200 [Patescibacteria group bacterium]|nr:hypothetical protein [Patescibacteria group bacterium]
MTLKKILAGATIAFLLGSPNVNFATNTKKNNRVYSEDSRLSVSGDGVILKDFGFDMYLNPDSETSLSEYLNKFKLKPLEGDINWSIGDAKEGLRDVINYLKKDLNSLDSLSKKKAIATINHYERLINEIPESDKNSLNNLEKLLYNGSPISKDDMKNIQEGPYMFIAKSNTDSVPVVVYLNWKTPEGGDYLDKKIIDSLDDISLRLKPTPDRRRPLIFPLDCLDRKTSKNEDFSFSPYENNGGEKDTLREAQSDSLKSYEPEGSQKGQPVPKKIKSSYGAKIFGGLSAGKNGFRRIEAGVGYGPVSFVVNSSEAGDQKVREISVPLSEGILGVGEEYNSNFRSVGVGGEIDISRYLSVGAGVNQWTSTNHVKESIVSSSGEIIKENENSKNQKSKSYNVNSSINFPILNDLSLGLTGGYNWMKDHGESGAYGGIRLSYHPNNRRNKNEK